MLDDVAVALPGANPSAEARVAAIVHGFEIDDEPSAQGWAEAGGQKSLRGGVDRICTGQRSLRGGARTSRRVSRARRRAAGSRGSLSHTRRIARRRESTGIIAANAILTGASVLRSNRCPLLIAAVCSLLCASSPPALAEVVGVDIESRVDVPSDDASGNAHAYEVVTGKIRFAVDPANARNRVIVGLDRAPRNAARKVEFSADIAILRPKDPAKGNGTLLFDVVNRGNKTVLNSFDRAAVNGHDDGFLMRRGFTVLWVGWEFDAPDGTMRIDVPSVERRALSRTRRRDAERGRGDRDVRQSRALCAERRESVAGDLERARWPARQADADRARSLRGRTQQRNAARRLRGRSHVRAVLRRREPAGRRSWLRRRARRGVLAQEPRRTRT